MSVGTVLQAGGPIVIGIGVVFAGVGSLLVIGGAGALRQWWLIRTSELGTVYDAGAGGPVVLEGTARPAGETLAAPFTDVECLAYEYEIEEYDPDDDGSDWDTVARGRQAVPFLLEGAAGSVLVAADAEGMELDVGDDETTRTVPGGDEPPDPIREFIERTDDVGSENRTLDLGILELDYGARRRYREARLEPGETTFVGGVARSRHGVDRPVPSEATAVIGPNRSGGLLARWRAEVPALVADAPKDEVVGRKLESGVAGVVVGLVFAGAGIAILLA